MDVAVSGETQRLIDGRPYLADVICGRAIQSDPAVRRHVTTVLTEFKPEVVVIEQVYPYLGFRALVQDLRVAPRLVFSSQNVEHEMKADMYRAFGVPPEVSDGIRSEIRESEAQLARESALVIVVSEQDRETFQALGAVQTVLAPNGTRRLRTTPAALERHRRFLHDADLNRTFAFVSSAHQPNWQGFIDMIGTRMGFLEFGTGILLCGSVCDLATAMVAPTEVETVTFWQRVWSMGQLDDDDLAAVLLSADASILPITFGGGSNLKTAEALASGIPIVATSFAFRGYEEYLDFPGVWVADSPEGFRTGMLAALRTEPKPRSQTQAGMIEQLQWDHRLRDMVEAVAAI